MACFYEIPECANEWVSDPCVFFSWLLFLLFVLSNSNVLAFVLSYYVILFSNYPLEAGLFSNERQEGGESGWERRWGKEETINKIYYVKRKVFSMKVKKITIHKLDTLTYAYNPISAEEEEAGGLGVQDQPSYMMPCPKLC